MVIYLAVASFLRVGVDWIINPFGTVSRGLARMWEGWNKEVVIRLLRGCGYRVWAERGWDGLLRP